MIHESRDLIGQDDVVRQVQRICTQKRYLNPEIHPEHFLIPLSRGNGQHALMRYAADAYLRSGVIPSCGGRGYAFFAPDGSEDDLDRMLNEIWDTAVYTNAPEGVIAIDLSSLMNLMNAYQGEQIVLQLPRIGQTATLILFLPETAHVMESSLAKSLQYRFGEKLISFKSYVYPPVEIAQITEKCLLHRGISMSDAVRERVQRECFLQNMTSLPDGRELFLCLLDAVTRKDDGFAVDEKMLNAILGNREKETLVQKEADRDLPLSFLKNQR